MDRSWSSVIPKDLQLNMPTPLYLSKMLFTDVQLLLYSKKKTTTTTTCDERISAKAILTHLYSVVTTDIYSILYGL